MNLRLLILFLPTKKNPQHLEKMEGVALGTMKGAARSLFVCLVVGWFVWWFGGFFGGDDF